MTAPVFARHVVVDGSNIATEGRSMPSLAQLDEAVREYRREFPDDTIVVVVDATFGHRIDESERATFDEAVAHNEIVSPPAGAIGRGDAFLLRIAEKVGATVLSNDSFQEFHGEYDWLFTNGRLIGGKPVPGVGWIFTPRSPVRGPRSRDAVRTAKRGEERGPRRPKPEVEQEKVQKAIKAATEEVVEPDSPSVKRRRRRRGSPPPAEPVNEPLAFIELVAKYPLGSEIEGTVETFSSHGAFVDAGGARCYIPLSALGDPPPRAAKDVLRKGEVRTFVIQALDPPRRGVELALPEFAHISGSPSPETVEEEIRTSEADSAKQGSRSRGGRGRGGGRRRSAPAELTAESEPIAGEAAHEEPHRDPEPAPAGVGAPAAVVPDRVVPDEAAPARAARKRAAAKAAAAAPAKARAPRKAAPAVTSAEPVGEPAPAKHPRKKAAPPAAAPTPAATTAPVPPAPARKRTPTKVTKATKATTEAIKPAPAATKPTKATKATKATKVTKATKPTTKAAAAKAAAPTKTAAKAPATKTTKATKAPTAGATTPKKADSPGKVPASRKTAVKKVVATRAPAPKKAPAVAKKATRAAKAPPE